LGKSERERRVGEDDDDEDDDDDEEEEEKVGDGEADGVVDGNDADVLSPLSLLNASSVANELE